MKSSLVLILVALAAGGLFFVLRGGSESGDNESDPSVVERDAPGTSTDDPAGPAVDLQAVNGGRDAAPIEVAPRIVDAAPLSGSVAAVGAGDLRGLVVDPKGRPVLAARVILTRYGADAFFFGDVDRSTDVETRTGSEGTFEFKNVPAFEAYSLIVTHPDHSRTEVPGIVVQDGLLREGTEIVLGYGVSLRGTVTDTGGNAVPAAKLVLSQSAFISQMGAADDAPSVETDEAGRFEFKNVTPQQSYSLRVTADGYGTISVSAVVSDTKDTVQDIVLEVASLIAGIVRSATDGTPIEGATIQAWSMNTQAQQRSRTETTSNEDGEFEISDITPGRYQLVVRHPLFAPDPSKKIEAGEMNVVIDLQPRSVITGQVVDFSTGTPVTRFEVQLRQAVPGAQDGMSTALVATRARFDNAEGRFQLVAPKPGEYIVEAIARGFADSSSDSFQTTMGQDVSGITVRMTRGGVLIGRVLGDGGLPIKGAVVETHDKEWSDDPFWQALGAGAPGNATESSVRTDDEGAFRLKNLTPANYQLVVRHRDYAQRTVKDIVVTEGQETRVEDVLLPRGATISGTVRGPSGRPQSGALVKLFPTTAGAGKHTVQTNKEGEYTVRNVRSGSYKIHATRPRTGSDNPFQESVDMKNTQRSLTVSNGQSLIGQDFKLNDR